MIRILSWIRSSLPFHRINSSTYWCVVIHEKVVEDKEDLLLLKKWPFFCFEFEGFAIIDTGFTHLSIKLDSDRDTEIQTSGCTSKSPNVVVASWLYVADWVHWTIVQRWVPCRNQRIKGRFWWMHCRNCIDGMCRKASTFGNRPRRCTGIGRPIEVGGLSTYGLFVPSTIAQEPGSGQNCWWEPRS